MKAYADFELKLSTVLNRNISYNYGAEMVSFQVWGFSNEQVERYLRKYKRENKPSRRMGSSQATIINRSRG